MDKQEEIHLVTLQELSQTNKRLFKQLDKTMSVVKEQQALLQTCQDTCRQIVEDIRDKKTEDVLEIAWYQALINILNMELSLTFDDGCQKGHMTNEIHCE